jgi:hypothetical protein
MDVVKSKNDSPIRLTEKRWVPITEEHSEMAGYYFEVLETVEEPEVILLSCFLLLLCYLLLKIRTCRKDNCYAHHA